MRLTGSFVLPQDAELQPAAELTEELRRSSGAEEGDFALSRKNSRSHSRIVDANAAELIRQFEKPRTIAAAVAKYSRAQPNDPGRISAEQILEDALPLLRSLIREGLLVEADSPQALPTAESFAAGDRIDEREVARCIQSVEDTELYLVSNSAGQWGALKIARPGDAGAKRTIERESALLSGNLVGSLPRLLATGVWQDRQYLITEWFPGIDVESAAAEIRSQGDLVSRSDMLRLGEAILEAYCEFHEQSFVHGDIHPRNLLVDRNGVIKILDLGLAARLSEPSHRRAGISFFFEPELARAALDEAPTPTASLAGEQYAIAALLYRLLTGSHTQDFKLERVEMLTQIATGAVVPFAQRGLAPWPEIEIILAKALSKDPVDRYPSTRKLSEVWRAVGLSTTSPAVAIKPCSALNEIRQEVPRKSAIGGEWMREAFKVTPTAPVNNGSAGLAYALHRIACASGDGELHAIADAWSTRTIQAIERAESFEDPKADTSDVRVGLASLQHQRPGVFTTEALIAAARGDSARQVRAIDQFVAWAAIAAQEPDAPIDLALGFAGSLFGATLLLDSLAEAGPTQRALACRYRLLACGQGLYAKMWSRLDRLAAIGKPFSLQDTGAAHGWAGILYASLLWNTSSKESVPDPLRQRLDQLAARAEPYGRGLRWPWGARHFMPGWCNGSAGQVFLWTAAHKALGDDRYQALAEGAAWSNWEVPSQLSSLCCGLAGQAYALLNFHRHTGDAIWLDRATRMANWAAAAAVRTRAANHDEVSPDKRPGGLYNGLAGLAVLATELERPLESGMPLYEPE